MKKLFVLGSVFALFSLVAPPTACYYDNEVDQYGTATCDTTNTRYSVEMTDLLNTHCRSCHTVGGSASPEFDTYDQVQDAVVNGNFLSRINDASSPMPPTGLMTACNRLKVQAWKDAGAKNN